MLHLEEPSVEQLFEGNPERRHATSNQASQFSVANAYIGAFQVLNALRYRKLHTRNALSDRFDSTTEYHRAEQSDGLLDTPILYSAISRPPHQFPLRVGCRDFSISQKAGLSFSMRKMLSSCWRPSALQESPD